MPINKIKQVCKIEPSPNGQHAIEIIIKNKTTGDVMYQNDSYAGLLYSSEKIMQLDLEVEDRHQILCWGSALVQPHAMMMIKKSFIERKDEFFAEIDKLNISTKQKDFIKINFEKICG